MNVKLKGLYDQVEYNSSHGVYRSEFFRLAGESLRATRDEPRPIRRAKAMAHVLGHVDLVVQPHELIGGTIAGLYPKVEVPSYEERKKEARRVLEAYMENKGVGDELRSRITLYSRVHYHGNVEYKDLQRMIRELTEELTETCDITGLEIAGELERHFNWDFGEDAKLVGELPWEVSNHNDLNPFNFLYRGLADIRQEVAERLEAAGESSEKAEFYQCEMIAVNSIIGFVARYAAAFAAAAGKEPDEERAGELRRIAAALNKVSTEKPDTFFEAIQLLWVLYIGFNMQACAGTTSSFTRFDQYMNPFYKNDLEKGIITEEEALLLICNLFVKINEPKMRVVISMCIGGQTRDGKDAANEVTKLCLKAIQTLKQPYPNVAVRLFHNSPEWLYDLIVETIKTGAGNPMLLNDEVMVGNLFRGGFALEDARDYYNVGCVETMIMGKSGGWLNVDDMNFPNILQKVLDNGGICNYYSNVQTKRGEPIFTKPNGFSNFPYPVPGELKTGELEEFETFDQFMDAYRNQMYHSLSLIKERSDVCDEILAEYWFDPFASLFQDDCLERGLDIYGGGAKYFGMKEVIGLGLATAADSLAAIRKFVYEDKKFTLRELKHMLDVDFEGYELERLLLQNGTPCYGNGIQETDQLANTIFEWYFDCVDRVNKMGIKGFACTSVYSYTSQVAVGEITPATPNGRHKGMAISNSITPSHGRDVKGPTSTLNSVTKIDYRGLNGATTVNLKLNPGVVNGKAGSENMKSLIKAYFKDMGMQLQINFLDTAVLYAAQENPDEYGSLIVRVGGYCEYFNNLDRALQNEVIAHVEQEIE